MQSRLPFIFIIITVVLDSMGIGLIMPVMPDLIREVRGADLGEAAKWGGFLVFSYAVMQFLFGPVLGNLSDRFGRRPVLLAALAVMAADYLIMALAGSIWLLIVGRIIAGITGATHSTASAYMADISPPEKKAQNFGLIGAAFGVGFILGPLIGGFLGEFGARAPFYAAMALAAANFTFGFFVLPESVTDRIRRPFAWRRANPFGAFTQVRKVPGLARLSAVFFFYNIAFFVYPAIWAYFTRERFGWDAGMVGVSLAAFGLTMALVQGWLIRLVIPRLGEHRTVMLGMSFNVLAFVAYLLATEGWMIFALVPLAAAGAMTGPALQGIMSRTVGDDAQGELQGMLTSLAAVGMILSPVIMTQSFAYFTSEKAPIYLPGAPFLISAALVGASVVIFAGRTRLGGGRRVA